MQVVIIHIINFSYIVVTEDIINCKSFVNYKDHIIQKVAVEVMINFVARRFIAYINAARVVVK